MNHYQIIVIIALFLSLLCSMSRASKAARSGTHGVAVGTIAVTLAIQAVVPYCLIAGGFFK